MKTCGKTNCEPVEQIRGEMGPGDYHDIIAAHSKARSGAMMEPEKYGAVAGPEWKDGQDDGHHVEIDDSNRNDYRIVCKTCGKATPWNKQDAPNMPGVGKLFTQKLWDNGV